MVCPVRVKILADQDLPESFIITTLGSVKSMQWLQVHLQVDSYLMQFLQPVPLMHNPIGDW
jgi:hypothetical protein